MSDTNNYPTEFNLKELTLESFKSAPTQFHNLPGIKQHYSNGLSKYVENVRVEIVSDIRKCKLLWNSFAQKKSLFDTWNFRYSFHLPSEHSLYFLIIKKGLDIVALLPLSYNTFTKKYNWFGTDWSEDNGFFAKDPFYIPLMLFLAPRPISLEAIREEDVKKVPSFVEFKVDDSKYILNLENFTSVESYLSSLRKKKRYNLKRDRIRIESYNPTFFINRFKDYAKWVEMCKKRFSEKGEKADFEEDPRYITFFKQIIQNGKNVYETKMISVEIEKKLVAADINVIYGDGYYTLHGGGYDIDNYPGIGNYMNLIEIQDAIDLGLKKIDFLAINYGWKKSWFSEIPLYKYQVA